MMNELLAIIFLTILLSGTSFLIHRLQLRRTYRQLNSMLEDAFKGEFTANRYDESQMSKLSVRLKQFLTSSQLAKDGILKEKESIKTLISDISHQTKTPITNILVYTQLLSEDQKLTPGNKKHLELIKGQAEKLDFLFQSMVKISRLETGIITLKPTRGILNQAVLSALEEVRCKAESKKLALNTTLDVDYKAVFDLKWTIEAIYNILDNAVKYTQPGGSIAISMVDYEMFVRVDISDTGLGISEEEIPLIFQRFYRGREVGSQEGVGIGLYLTRQILIEEGGYIKVTSKPKEGSIFSLFFSKAY